jgi:hypothetical protein
LSTLYVKKLARFRGGGHQIIGDRHCQSESAAWDFVHIAVDAFRSYSRSRRTKSVSRSLISWFAHYAGSRDTASGSSA